MTPVTHFVIDRNIWLRGDGGYESYLLRSSDGKQCCLGIYLEACGISRGRLNNSCDPSCLVDEWSDVPDWMSEIYAGTLAKRRQAEAVNALIKANDDESLTQDELERQIACGFAKQGITVDFIN